MGRCSPARETSQENKPFLNVFLRRNVSFGLQTTFFDGFNVLMSFLAENDAERSRSFFKKQFLNPKHVKLFQLSYFQTISMFFQTAVTKHRPNYVHFV